MSAIRAFQPLLRSAPRLTTRTAAPATKLSRRFLNTETAPSIYAAHAVATGGRAGHVEGDEGLKLDLAPPKAMSGKSSNGKTNPEEMFAAGYGACFQNAMMAVAPSMGIKLGETSLDAVVHLVGDLKKLDIGLRVEMTVKARGMKKEDVERLVEKTKTVCPYSRATEGNVATSIKIEV